MGVGYGHKSGAYLSPLKRIILRLKTVHGTSQWVQESVLYFDSRRTTRYRGQALSAVSAARLRNTMRRDDAMPIAASFSSCVMVRDTVSIVRPK
jgi:hypothetical protein